MQFKFTLYSLLLIALLLGNDLSGQNKAISYLPLGDSYTIGEGLEASQRFPNQLLKLLKSEGVTLKLLANPAQTGWTTADLINNELALFKQLKPQFATLLIGVNDWVQGVNEVSFSKNFQFILTEMLAVLPNKSSLIVLTIPDFSATPKGARYGNGRDISQGIAQYNKIIKKLCIKNNITLVDIFEVSQDMKNHPEYISADGLHPSELEYGIWAEMIKPAALKNLNH